jgi:hypothetical protein
MQATLATPFKHIQTNWWKRPFGKIHFPDLSRSSEAQKSKKENPPVKYQPVLVASLKQHPT